MAKAKGKPKSTHKVTLPTISPEEEAKQRRAKQLEEQARQQKAAEAAAAAAAKEKDAQRQWILQYAEDDSESDSDGHDAEQVSRCSFTSCANSQDLFACTSKQLHTRSTQHYLYSRHTGTHKLTNWSFEA